MRRTKPPPHRTPGSVQFEAFLRETKTSHESFANELGVAQPSVSAWVAGTARPEPEKREAIAILTGVPVPAWYTPEELALVERARAAKASRGDAPAVANDNAVAGAA